MSDIASTPPEITPDIIFPEPYQVIEPAKRTAQQWVDYYLQIENDLLAGKDVTFDGGRRVIMENLDKIREARMEWERRAHAEKASRCARRIGGFRYSVPDLTR